MSYSCVVFSFLRVEVEVSIQQRVKVDLVLLFLNILLHFLLRLSFMLRMKMYSQLVSVCVSMKI
jgi:hypothetical protein